MTEFKHRIYSPGRQRVYWNGNRAADERTATHAEVGVHNVPCGLYIRFEWPAQKAALEKLERMLDYTYEAGVRAAKKEIRDVLGVREPRL